MGEPALSPFPLRDHGPAFVPGLSMVPQHGLSEISSDLLAGPAQAIAV
jgi:hypothetical protein